jgi:hypothetical protein
MRMAKLGLMLAGLVATILGALVLNTLIWGLDYIVHLFL